MIPGFGGNLGPPQFDPTVVAQPGIMTDSPQTPTVVNGTAPQSVFRNQNTFGMGQFRPQGWTPSRVPPAVQFQPQTPPGGFTPNWFQPPPPIQGLGTANYMSRLPGWSGYLQWLRQMQGG